MIHSSNDTIVALATAPGLGAISVIRIAGKDAINKCSDVFYSKKGKQNLQEKASHTVNFGIIKSGSELIDEVLVSVFKAPNSYTGENIVEISCHGSVFIQQQLINLFLSKGCRAANPGEFTMRAFLNGKLDLSQAEAVADLIESESKAAHRLALDQMRGGFSNELKKLRDELIQFASLIELELDFSEEDVEFADRTQLQIFIEKLTIRIQGLIASFELGNVLKSGVTTVIAGKPNSGKSTLLNALLKEDRAIVSEIPGTTRDTIEELLNINGILFRFIDTAGIRQSLDSIEEIGVRKTFEKIKKAEIAILLFDVTDNTSADIEQQVKELNLPATTQLLCVGNKIDLLINEQQTEKFSAFNPIYISSKESLHIEKLLGKLISMVMSQNQHSEGIIISNARHFQELKKSLEALNRVSEGIQAKLSGELLSADIRNALYHIGLITGEVSTDDLLESIFTRFCIGK